MFIPNYLSGDETEGNMQASLLEGNSGTETPLMSCHPVAGEIGVAQLESFKTASELELTLAGRNYAISLSDLGSIGIIPAVL